MFDDEIKEVKNGSRKGKSIIDDSGLAYLVHVLKSGELKGINKPGIELTAFINRTGLQATEKQKAKLGNYTHALNRVLPARYGIRVYYGTIDNEPSIYLKWTTKDQGKKVKYEIAKTEIKKLYDWIDEYIPAYKKVQTALDTIDTEGKKKKPNKKVIKENQAIVTSTQLPSYPAVKVEVIKA